MATYNINYNYIVNTLSQKYKINLDKIVSIKHINKNGIQTDCLTTSKESNSCCYSLGHICSDLNATRIVYFKYNIPLLEYIGNMQQLFKQIQLHLIKFN
jgi:hypothetical protein